LLGNLFLCLTTLSVKNLFLISSLNLLSSSLKPVPLVLSLPVLIASPSPAFLSAPFKRWKAATRSPGNLLFSRLKSPSFVSPSSQRRCHLRGPPLNLLQQLHVLLVLGASELDTVLRVRSHESRVEGQNHLPQPAGTQDMVDLLGCKCTLPAHAES